MARRKSLKRGSLKRKTGRKTRTRRYKKGGGLSGLLARSAARTASSVATGTSKFAAGIAANQAQKSGLITKEQAKLGTQSFNTGANALNSGFKQVMTREGIQNIKGAISNPQEAFTKIGASATEGIKNVYNNYSTPEQIAQLKGQVSNITTNATEGIRNVYNPEQISKLKGQVSNITANATEGIKNMYNNNNYNTTSQQTGAGKRSKKRRQRKN
jgi:hypothetical protein